jgi:hypothetical protein
VRWHVNRSVFTPDLNHFYRCAAVGKIGCTDLFYSVLYQIFEKIIWNIRAAGQKKAGRKILPYFPARIF